MRPFAASDLPEVAGWYSARGFSGLRPGHLPKHGAIVPGVAAGWLYRTDSDVGLLDGFVTNPSAPLRERSKAVDAISSHLIELARHLGVRHLVAMCLSAGIHRRSRKLGLRPGGTVHLALKEL
jgi:sugar phosphate isomerase/epimerase